MSAFLYRNFFTLFAEKIDFFHSLLRCYQLLHLISLKPQFMHLFYNNNFRKTLDALLIIETSTPLKTIECLVFVIFLETGIK